MIAHVAADRAKNDVAATLNGVSVRVYGNCRCGSALYR
jgi:hypothetical protein